MKLSNLRKTMLASAAALALTLGASASAMAATVPTFTLAPGALGGPYTAGEPTFTANKIDVTSSELLHTNASGGHTGSGWAQVTGFDLNNVAIPASPPNGRPGAQYTGINTNYGLYLTYTLSDVPASGTPNAANSTNNLVQLDFQFFADLNNDNTYTSANILPGGVGVEATVDPAHRGDDVLLAFGGLIVGTDGFDSLGGAFLNSIQSFAVCTGAGTATMQGTPVPAAMGAAMCTSGVGNAFFALPQPFYGLGFDEFNNTTQGLVRDASAPNLVAINQATGSIDFNRVPEPGSLALLGLGMLGAGLNLRRRTK